MKYHQIFAVVCCLLLLTSITAAVRTYPYLNQTPESYRSSTTTGLLFRLHSSQQASHFTTIQPAGLTLPTPAAIGNFSYFVRHADHFNNSRNATNPVFPVFVHRPRPEHICVFDYECPCAPNETPTVTPTEVPTEQPTEVPTEVPTTEPTEIPTTEPTEIPTTEPTPPPDPCENVTCEAGFHCEDGTCIPDEIPTTIPTTEPTEVPTTEPTEPPITDPCENVTCPEGYYCDGGTCFPIELFCPPGYHEENGECVPDEVPTTVPTTAPPCECTKNKDCKDLHGGSPCWKCVDGTCVPKDSTDDPNCGGGNGCLINVPGSNGEFGGYCFYKNQWIPCCGGT